MRPDLRIDLLAVAGSVLDAATGTFVSGLGAPSEVVKGAPNDFATAVDLELERTVSADLAAQTGIGVHGEEFGGPDLDSGPVWVLDPIDGTFNYSMGVPLCGMLLALIEDGEPTLGLTWLPLLGHRFSATVDGPVYASDESLPRLRPGRLAETLIGFGSLDPGHGPVPREVRLGLLDALTARSVWLRMSGSIGVDLAFVASGLLGGALVFGGFAWDVAAGVALVRAAGGVVTDLAGQPWTLKSEAMIAAAPGIHEELLALAVEVGGRRS